MIKNKLICDLCGKEIEELEGIVIEANGLGDLFISLKHKKKRYNRLDFCDTDCMAEFVAKIYDNS